MKIEKKTRDVKVVESSVTTTLCDFCQRDVDAVSAEDPGVTGTQDVEISAAIGVNHHYEGGDQRQFYRVDCCHACFLQRVIPLFQRAGVKPNQKESYDRFEADRIIDEREKLPTPAPVRVKTDTFVFAAQLTEGTRYFQPRRGGIGFDWVKSITSECLLTQDEAEACRVVHPQQTQQARLLRCDLFVEKH